LEGKTEGPKKIQEISFEKNGLGRAGRFRESSLFLLSLSFKKKNVRSVCKKLVPGGVEVSSAALLEGAGIGHKSSDFFDSFFPQAGGRFKSRPALLAGTILHKGVGGGNGRSQGGILLLPAHARESLKILGWKKPRFSC